MPRRTRGAKDERGVTLVEATIVLIVLAILAAAAAPVASRTLDRARLSRAAEDATAIKAAINSFISEHTLFVPFTSNGAAGGDAIEVLVGDGDTPASAVGATSWDDPVICCGAAVDVDFLERHLVTNTPAGGGAYSTLAGGWRGTYITGPIDPDPWGNRYAVNVQFLKTTTANDVFVLSAGPDEEVETAFTVNGAVPGGDDIIDVIRRDSGLTVP